MRALSQTVEKFYIFEAPVEMFPSGEPEERSFGRGQFQHPAHNLGNGIQRQARTPGAQEAAADRAEGLQAQAAHALLGALKTH